MVYHYQAFGLFISSEIKLGELSPISLRDQTDVTIRIGETSTSLKGDNLIDQVVFQSTPTEYLLSLDGIANYYVLNGREVIITPHKQANQEAISLFLLTSVMPVILHHHQIIPLRATAIKHQQKVVLMCGLIGVGKSTTAVRLHQRGYPFYSDEICGLKQESNGTIKLIRGYPFVCLWKDTLEHLDQQFFKSTNQMRKGIAKYFCHFTQPPIEEELDISQVIIMKSTAKPELTEKSSQLEIFKYLLNYTLYHEMLFQQQKDQQHFQMMMKLLSQSQASVVNRSLLLKQPKEFLDYIEDVITQ